MTRVFVYKNLHKGCYSVRDEATGRVILHANYILVEDAKFVVQPAGRARVLREHRKNVHAGVRGELRAHGGNAAKYAKDIPTARWRMVRYNPYEMETFQYLSGDPIRDKDLVYLDPGGVFVVAP